MAQAQTAASLGAEDYQLLASMLRSEDASVRAQGQSLAKKLTPDEQQQFFDVQQAATRGKDATSNRADSAIVGGLPVVGSVTPEDALGAGMAARAIGTAINVPGAVSRVVAGANAVVTQAAPLVKYEATKTLLEKAGVPSSLATIAAMAVSGYQRNGAKATPAEAPHAPTAEGYSQYEPNVSGYDPSAPAASVEPPAPTPTSTTPKPGPRTVNEAMAEAVKKAQAQAAAARAATTAAATSPVESARGGTPPPADRPPAAAPPESPATPAKPKLTADEAKEYLRLRRNGLTDAEAKNLLAFGRRFGGQLPTDAEVRQIVQGRNATGKWPTPEQ
jgi:hypothetical protein